MPVAAKVTLWVVGGVFALGCGGVLFLYGAAGYAMWLNAREIDRSQAQQEAAFKALKPEQKVAKAKEALARTQDPSFCLAILTSVPEGTPGRAEVAAEAAALQKQQDDARAAMEAMTPAQHLAAARAALDKGDFPTCRGHLFYVPKETPGCEALMAEARAKEDAADEAAGNR